MKKTFIFAALTGGALMLSALAPAQAAMVSVPGAAAGHDVQSELIQKTQRRGGVRRGGIRRGGVRRGRGWRRGRGRGRGAAIGAGIALGVLGAIAASEAHARNRDYERSCRRWRRQCYNGSDRACWRFENRC